MAEGSDRAPPPCDVLLLVKPLQQAVITRCDGWVFYNVFAVSLNFPVKHLLVFLRDPETGLAPDHLPLVVELYGAIRHDGLPEIDLHLIPPISGARFRRGSCSR